MVYTGQPSRGCATCRKRRIKCDEQLPECSHCLRIKQKCPGYKNHFDLAWRDQTVVAKKGVERGKAKRKAAREREEAGPSHQARPDHQARPKSPSLHAPKERHDASSAASSPGQVFTPSSRGSVSSASSTNSPPSTSFPIIHDSSDPQTEEDTIPHYDSVAPYVPPPTKLTFKEPTTYIIEPNPSQTILRPIPEEQALCYFFNNYVLPIRDPLARRGFLEYLGPFYSNADLDSPVKMSTMAVATCMMSTRLGYSPDTPLARSFYVQAVSGIKAKVAQQTSSDELIVAVMLLQLYEYEASIGHLTKRTTNPHPHLDGALALIRHRGAWNFTAPISLSILFYVRSLLIDEAFRSGAPLPKDVQSWSSLVPENEQLPGFRLDTINLDLANLKAASFSAINSPPTKFRSSQIQSTIKDAVSIDHRLAEWGDNVPETWIPVRVSVPSECIPHTLQLYQDYCDIYKAIFLASLWNKLRLSQIEAKYTLLSLLSQLPRTFSNVALIESCQHGIQTLADDICATVPYYIGDRMKPGRAGDRDVKYPHAPGRPPTPDHYQSGPTMGGWSLLAPLGTLTRMNIRLREGQRQWIGGQMARIARVYNITKIGPGPKKTVVN